MRRVRLADITTIKQSGFVSLCEIERDGELGVIEVGRLIGGGSNILVKDTAKMIYKLSERYSYIKKKTMS